MFTDLEYQGTPSRASQQSLRLLHTLLYRRLTKLQGCAQRISGTSRFFFESSGATNSTIGSYQIDYVNLRPNRATEWDSTPKRCSRASSLDAPLLGEADGAVAYHAARLGIPRSTLESKIRSLNVD